MKLKSRIWSSLAVCGALLLAIGSYSTSANAQFGNGSLGADAAPAVLDGQGILPQIGSPVPAVVMDAKTAAEAPPSIADKARADYWSGRLPLKGPQIKGGRSVAPPSGSETRLDRKAMADDTFVRFYTRSLLPTIPPGGFSSSTNEPSAAMSGRNRIQTGNWYALLTSDAGATWSSFSPFTAFPAIDGGFCCDQDVLYEPSRGIFLWYLQYIKSGSTAGDKGSFRIAVFNSATANLSGAGWFTYTFDPTMFGGGGGEWFDYPHIAVSNNFLYIAINVFTTTTDSWTRTLMIRLPLTFLRNGWAVTPVYLSQNSFFNFTPIQGAKDIMFWASQISGTQIRIFRWPDSGAGITQYTRNVTPWLAGGIHNCPAPAPAGFDWCQRSDNRIGAGVYKRNDATGINELWWFWNVREGGAFTYPYIEGAAFRESDLIYTGRPLLWSSNAPWHYLGAAPNGRGDVAVSVAYGHPPSFYPGSVVCLDDDYNGTPAPWECYTMRTGAFSPSSNRWGDYLRVRPAYPAEDVWIGTGFTLQSSSASGNAEPRNFVFGRDRDKWEYYRWFNR